MYFGVIREILFSHDLFVGNFILLLCCLVISYFVTLAMNYRNFFVLFLIFGKLLSLPVLCFSHATNTYRDNCNNLRHNSFALFYHRMAIFYLHHQISSMLMIMLHCHPIYICMQNFILIGNREMGQIELPG